MYSGLSVEDVTSSDVVAAAVSKELATFWPMERELLATIVEMLHVLILTTQKAHGGKNLPKPIHIERPDQARSPRASSPSHPGGGGKAPVIRMSEFVSRDRRGDL